MRSHAPNRASLGMGSIRGSSPMTWWHWLSPALHSMAPSFNMPPFAWQRAPEHDMFETTVGGRHGARRSIEGYDLERYAVRDKEVTRISCADIKISQGRHVH